MFWKLSVGRPDPLKGCDPVVPSTKKATMTVAIITIALKKKLIAKLEIFSLQSGGGRSAIPSFEREEDVGSTTGGVIQYVTFD